MTQETIAIFIMVGVAILFFIFIIWAAYESRKSPQKQK